VVYLVGLGVREVDDDGRLVIVDVGDVHEFVVSYHKERSRRDNWSSTSCSCFPSSSKYQRT
jgi:hypothetical protein